ncbi:MAG: YceH family protein [Bacteroidetes bacterium]|nr:YceH family protein [Bacteroidota bacterium]
MELLSCEEVRLIGSLIEKEHATPEYYPMTVNSLTNACNQKSSRNPVVSYDDTLVETIIQQLREKTLITKITGPDQRVPKYGEIFSEFYNLTKQQTAVICVLFLRGAQTIGEIKSRSYRIYEFKDLAETEQTLDELINREEGAFVVKLPKDSGRENRYTHLFCGEPEKQSEQVKQPKLEDRVAELEEKVNSLEELYGNLKDEFESFRKSFE